MGYRILTLYDHIEYMIIPYIYPIYIYEWWYIPLSSICFLSVLQRYHLFSYSLYCFWWEVNNDFKLWSLLCHMFFSLATIKVFSFIICFQQYDYNIPEGYFMFVLFEVYWCSYICKLTFFIRFGKLWTIIYSKYYFWFILSPFWKFILYHIILSLMSFKLSDHFFSHFFLSILHIGSSYCHDFYFTDLCFFLYCLICY